jgi:hypothetical protein
VIDAKPGLDFSDAHRRINQAEHVPLASMSLETLTALESFYNATNCDSCRKKQHVLNHVSVLAFHHLTSE